MSDIKNWKDLNMIILTADLKKELLYKNWFFRTTTYHSLGTVVNIDNNFIQLEDASWIADSGRFMNFLKEGIVEEVEPVGTCYVNLNYVVDFFPWKHKLFNK